MNESLDIALVAKLTGLTSRALRFYEARGLLEPLRTASGRRFYGPAELERLHHILAMKRAGLTLAQIQKLTQGRRVDLRTLIAGQLETLEERKREIAASCELLNSILSRIDRSEPIDVATFCSLIRNGDMTMSAQKWAEVQQRYMSQEQLKAFEESQARLPEDFDWEAHHASWQALNERICAALPMDPASPKAQAFLDEWDALIAPFLAVATPEMIAGVQNLNDHVEEWEGEVEGGMSSRAYRFHQEAHRAREAMKARS